MSNSLSAIRVEGYFKWVTGKTQGDRGPRAFCLAGKVTIASMRSADKDKKEKRIRLQFTSDSTLRPTNPLEK
jgi:hypothetical protein